LEGGWRVAHDKEHNLGFKEPSSGFEGSFPLVIVVDLNIVITLSHVKFAEELHSLEIFDAFCEIW
jgi:hypothetical protein